MKRTPTIMVLAAMLCFGADAWAQEARTAPTPDATLREMVTAPTQADRDRAAVLAFLDREDVREAAEANGMELDGLESRVLALDAPAAADLAERVADTEQQIGGDTRIVISSTAIIVALLLIIIFMVD